MLLSDTDLAYLAGLLDGEGCFTVFRAGSSYRPSVSMGMTSLDLIAWVNSIWPGNFHKEKSGRQGGNNEAAYHWAVTDRTSILENLPPISQYLKLKKTHAQVLLRYCELYPSQKGVMLSTESLEERAGFRSIFAELNATGVGSSKRKDTILKELATILPISKEVS